MHKWLIEKAIVTEMLHWLDTMHLVHNKNMKIVQKVKFFCISIQGRYSLLFFFIQKIALYVLYLNTLKYLLFSSNKLNGSRNNDDDDDDDFVGVFIVNFINGFLLFFISV